MRGRVDTVDGHIEVLLSGVRVLVAGEHQAPEIPGCRRRTPEEGSPDSGSPSPVGESILPVEMNQNSVLRDSRIPAALVAQLDHVTVTRGRQRRTAEDRHRGRGLRGKVADGFGVVERGELDRLLRACAGTDADHAVAGKPPGLLQLDGIHPWPPDSLIRGKHAEAIQAASDVVQVTVVALDRWVVFHGSRVLHPQGMARLVQDAVELLV